MGSPRLAISVATTVVFTLAVAAIAYGSMVVHLHGPAVLQTPAPSPSPSTKPLPSPVPSAGGLFVLDQDMVDGSTGSMLLSDCDNQSKTSCHYLVARTRDGGVTWSRLVQVGPAFATTDGDAPRVIRLLNSSDGFVYGHRSAFVTHDAGNTWARSRLPAAAVSSITTFGDAVWAVTYPCAKGTVCPYEVRSSRDGGRTWSAAHQLPAGFSPEETAVAFANGLALSSVPQGNIVITTDRGATWTDIRSACTGNPFRGHVTTSDGKDLWQLCVGNPDSAGQITNWSLHVSADGGRSWTRRDISKLGLLAWVISSRPRVAFTNIDHATLVSRDGGRTWASLMQGNVDFVLLRFNDDARGWALDGQRDVWVTSDSGDTWNRVAHLPDRLR